MTAGWEVGTDIGGTFTDIVAVHAETGETRTAKVPSRPDAPVDAMLDAIAAVGLDGAQLRRFVHGTTRVTNAIVEDRLPPVALVATAGFEDVLEIGRYRRRDLYRLDIPPKAPPLVPHGRCFGLRERMDHTGAVLLVPGEAELDRMADWLRGLGVSSVAVCLLHAYAHPAHERLVAERLRGVVPHVSLSHEVNGEAREYERASSTAFNAAAMPVAAEYLAELERRLPLGAGLQVFHSAGGMVPVPVARALPVCMAMSGPAAGVAASASVARALRRNRVLTFDMGGTTTDVCLVLDGAAEMTDARATGDRPLRQPMLAVHSIGAGGGSVVRLGPGGLDVGPDSAGVDPGPACYGRGGTRPTVTDADAVLGYLDPDARLGGRIALDVTRAQAALGSVAAALGLDVVDTALGVRRVAHAAMARALRRVTVERGIDGRDCTLLAFGGGGPMHAAGLAEAYGLAAVVVPAASSAFSALGCLLADRSFTQQRTVRLALDGLDADAFAAVLAALVARTAEPLRPGPVQTECTALVRYAAQSDATPVPFTAPLDPAALRRDFLARHRAVFGYATDEPCVIEGLRVQARIPAAVRPHAAAVPAAPGPARFRPCSFPGARDVRNRRVGPGRRGGARGGAGNHRRPVVHRGRAAGVAGGTRRVRRAADDPGGGMTAPNPFTPDPFTVEVIRHGLAAAAAEMSLVLVRSARSPLLREAGDLSSVVTDAAGHLVAQGRDIPVHIGAMAYTVRELLKVHPIERFRPGDALAYNVGPLGGNHLNDVKVVRPVFADGAVVAFTLSLAHWPDVGGFWPGSYYAAATDGFQEAMRIPPVPVATAAGVNAAVVDMIKANVRDPVSAEGDLLGQIAATAAAERRIGELCRTHGTDVFRQAIERLHDLAEAEMRDAIRGLPDGTWEGEDFLDDGGPGGAPARIHVRVTVAGDEATFDLSAAATACPTSATPPRSSPRSAVIYAARLLRRGGTWAAARGRCGPSTSSPARAPCWSPAGTGRWRPGTTKPPCAWSMPSSAPWKAWCPSGWWRAAPPRPACSPSRSRCRAAGGGCCTRCTAAARARGTTGPAVRPCAST